MERLTLGTAERRIEDDHLARYQFAARYVRDKVVLDIACGTGYGSEILAREAKEVYGVDNDIDAIIYAKANYSKPIFRWSIAEEILETEKFFDVVVCLETIEHLEDWQVDGFLKMLWRVMKDDGLLVMSTPNRWVVSPWTLKPSNKFHHREYTQLDLMHLLANYGFKTEAVRWQRYIPSFLLCPPVRLIYTLFMKLTGRKAKVYTEGEADECHIGYPMPNYTPRYFILLASKQHNL